MPLETTQKQYRDILKKGLEAVSKTAWYRYQKKNVSKKIQKSSRQVSAALFNYYITGTGKTIDHEMRKVVDEVLTREYGSGEADVSGVKITDPFLKKIHEKIKTVYGESPVFKKAEEELEKEGKTDKVPFYCSFHDIKEFLGGFLGDTAKSSLALTVSLDRKTRRIEAVYEQVLGMVEVGMTPKQINRVLKHYQKNGILSKSALSVIKTGLEEAHKRSFDPFNKLEDFKEEGKVAPVKRVLKKLSGVPIRWVRVKRYYSRTRHITLMRAHCSSLVFDLMDELRRTDFTDQRAFDKYRDAITARINEYIEKSRETIEKYVDEQEKNAKQKELKKEYKAQGMSDKEADERSEIEAKAWVEREKKEHPEEFEKKYREAIRLERMRALAALFETFSASAFALKGLSPSTKAHLTEAFYRILYSVKKGMDEINDQFGFHQAGLTVLKTAGEMGLVDEAANALHGLAVLVGRAVAGSFVLGEHDIEKVKSAEEGKVGDKDKKGTAIKPEVIEPEVLDEDDFDRPPPYPSYEKWKGYVEHFYRHIYFRELPKTPQALTDGSGSTPALPDAGSGDTEMGPSM